MRALVALPQAWFGLGVSGGTSRQDCGPGGSGQEAPHPPCLASATFLGSRVQGRVMKHPEDPNTLTCNVDDPVTEVARRLRQEEADRAVVLRSGQVAGIITERQIQVRAAAPGTRLEELKVADIMTFKDLAPTAPGLRGAARGEDLPSSQGESSSEAEPQRPTGP